MKTGRSQRNVWPLQRPPLSTAKRPPVALENALSAFGIRVEIKEWWEFIPEARRGTFEITLWSGGDDPFLDHAKLQDMAKTVFVTKPKSRVFTLIDAAEFTDGIFVSPAFGEVMIDSTPMIMEMP